MGDGHPKMKDINVAFEKRDKPLVSHLSELHLASEETFEAKNFETTRQEDQDLEKDKVLDNKSASTSRRQSAVSHPKLRRSHSDGVCSFPTTLSSTRRRALSLNPSITRLPKLPLRRLSSDSIATGNAVKAIATWHIYNQGVKGVKRNSIPEDKTVLYDLSDSHEPGDLVRRPSTSRCAAARLRRVSASSCRDSKWRVKLHKRNFSVDDDDSSDLGNALSRSSSSSGFSSQSSLF